MSVLRKGADFMTNEEKKCICDLRIQGLGYGLIAKKINSTKNAVRLYCKRQGLRGDFSVCKGCGKVYQKNNNIKASQFCSVKCYEKWWRKTNPIKRTVYRKKCPICNQEFNVLSKKTQKYCSCACYYQSRRKGCDC